VTHFASKKRQIQKSKRMYCSFCK